MSTQISPIGIDYPGPLLSASKITQLNNKVSSN